MHWARCEKDTRWKFAIRPTRKQLRAADPLIWDAAMKCALEQLSGPLSNLDTILSLSPLITPNYALLPFRTDETNIERRRAYLLPSPSNGTSF